jgi:hypothetical protein
VKDILWTRHSRFKMHQHFLSEHRVRKALNYPDRVEKGIAEGTVAMMKREKSTKKEFEVWVMLVDNGKSRKIISAWRYPGITEPGEPLPETILREIEEASFDAGDSL